MTAPDPDIAPADDPLAAEVRAGLTVGRQGGAAHTLPPALFYDARGSALFEEITTLDEYYPTRAEAEILTDRSAEIAAALAGTVELVELGAGSATKTRRLLDALDGLRVYRPVDVSAAQLAETAAAVAADHPGLRVTGVAADFTRALDRVPPAEGRRCVLFLGSTIGNFDPGERAAFLADCAALAGHGGTLLLGADLVKDRARLVAAYDDARGVTAAFNRNVLTHLNARFGGDADPEAFDHVARFDEATSRIEMVLRARRAMTITLTALDLTLRLRAGEEIRTEISTKFTRAGLERELTAAGLLPAAWWTDGRGDFALTLARRAGGLPTGPLI